MADDQQDATRDHTPPAGSSTTGTLNGLDYTATAEWLVLRKADKPTAEIFSTSYVANAAAGTVSVIRIANRVPARFRAIVQRRRERNAAPA